MQLIRQPIEHKTDLISAICGIPYLNLETGPWVGGGAARRIFDGSPWDSGDIDVFCASEQQAMAVIGAIHFRTGDRAANHGSHATFERSHWSHGRFEIQVITARYHADVEALLADFDYSITRFATDGKEIIHDATAVSDITRRRIHLANRCKRRKGFARLAKYCQYGFTPEPDALTTLIGFNDPVVRIKPGIRLDDGSY